MLLRSALFGFFGRLLDLYYRRHSLGGRVPTEGPLILVANHSNGLVDPVVVARSVGRNPVLLAKEPIFSIPVIGWMARAAGAIPVYRAVDGADTSRNQDMFREVHAALGRGEAVCLFPEGLSHNRPGLQPLKTGAARMALGAEAERNFRLGVRVVPIGMTYRDKTRFRSALAVEIGQAVAAAPYRSLWERDPRAAARELTAEIESAMRQVTLNLRAWEDLPLLQLAGRIWGGKRVHTVQRLRVFAAAAERVDSRFPERLHELRSQLLRFSRRLDRLGLDAHHLDARYPPGRILYFVLRNLAALLIGLPVALAAGLLYAPASLAVRAIRRQVHPSADIVATVNILAGLVCFPLWHLVLLWLAWEVLSPLGCLLAAALFPFAAFYAHGFLARRREAWHEARTFLALPFLGRARRLLRRERDELQRELRALAELMEAEDRSPQTLNPSS